MVQAHEEIEAALARFAGDVFQVADHLGANVRLVEAVWKRMSKIDKQKDGPSSLEKALARHGGSLAKAAADLGISVRAARSILQRLHTDAAAKRPTRQRRKAPRPLGPQVEPTEECGTVEAYRRHLRLRENADDLCRAAKAVDSQEQRAAKKATALR